MRKPPPSFGLLTAALLLAGCAGSQAATTEPTGRPSVPAATDQPTAAALMICSDDIRGKVQQVLSLSAAPATTHSFRGGRYTCTYRLPAGPLVLAVQQSPSPSAASRIFAGQQAALHGDTVPGLGTAAFGTSTGVVVVVKDSDTLTVDASRLPPVFGDQQQRRTDLAYEIASDVLGCWTGDE